MCKCYPHPPACRRHARHAVYMLASLAMAGRSPGTAYSENARMRGNGGQEPSPIKRAGADVSNPELYHAV
jgi:hypothetical protein